MTLDRDSVNCWNTLRAFGATTQPETVNVNAIKRSKDWAISIQALSESLGKVHRLPVISKAVNIAMKSTGPCLRPHTIRSKGTPNGFGNEGEDIVKSTMKVVA